MSEHPLTVVDVCMREISGLASEIAHGEVKEKRELRSYMTLEAGGGRRLFRYSFGPQESGIMERLLRGEESSPVNANGMSGPALREATEIENWVFEESAEPIARVAREAPFLVDAHDEPSALARNAQVSEWYAKHVSSRDVALDVISARLGDALRNNREKIAQGIQVVGAVELEASRAAVSAAIARQKLSEAKRDTVIDVLSLLQMRRRRERAALVLDVAKIIKSALFFLQAAKLSITTDRTNEFQEEQPDFSQATTAAVRAQKLLYTEPLSRVKALDGARNEAKLALPSLLFGVDARLWCLLDPSKYTIHNQGPCDEHLDFIVAAYGAIEDALETSTQQVHLQNEEETMSTLEDRVFTSLCDPPPKKLWLRIPLGLEGLGERVSGMVCSRLVQNMTLALNISYVQTHSNDYNIGQSKLEATRFAGVIISACDHAVGAIDVAHRVVLWHQTNYQTNDHEQYDDDDDDEEEDDDEDDDMPEHFSSSKMSLPQPIEEKHGASRSLFSPRKHKKHVLRRLTTRSALARALREVWRLASKCLFSALNFSSSEDQRPPRIEEVVAALAGVNVALCLARHNRAVENTNDRDALRIFGRDFLRLSRRNALSVLSQMLDCEPWCSISAQIEHIELLQFDTDNTLDTTHANDQTARCLEALVAQELCRISKDRFAELSMLCYGVAKRLAPQDNNLHAAVADLVVEDQEHQNEAEHLDTLEIMRTRIATLLDALPTFSLIEPCALAALRSLAKINSNATFCTKKKPTQSNVATQAAYHGVCKAVTKYVQISLLIDGAEDEVVDAIVELFELYVKQVALSFVPLAKLRSLSRKMRGDEDPDDPTEVLACDLDALEAFCKFAVRVHLFDEVFTGTNDEQNQFSFVATSKSKMNVFSPTRRRIASGDISPSKKNHFSLHDDDENDTSFRDMPRESEIRAAVVAARSIAFVSRVLCCSVATALDRATPGRKSAAKRRISELCTAADQLRGLVYRSLGPALAGTEAIIRAIHHVKHAWAAETIQEECNDYVELVAKRFDTLWSTLCYLVDNQSTEATNSQDNLLTRELQDDDRELLWTEAVQAAFEAVVDGFANVETCSTEGRALMSMDLQVLQFSLDKIHRARPNRGAVYADSYIKAFYFAEDDLLAWINQNKASYKERHMISLASARLGKSAKRKKNISDFLTRGFHAAASS